MNSSVITHRGLEPTNPNFPWGESTLGAFTNQLQRGFGLEFDLNRTKDDVLLVVHDKALTRISKGADTRLIEDCLAEEILFHPAISEPPPRFEELLTELAKASATIHALHIKSHLQNRETLALIADVLNSAPQIVSKLVAFDVTPQAAQQIKELMPNLALAPSVSHPFDIERYGSATGNTLISVEDAIANRDLFSWVWLDEWDTADRNGSTKRLYTAETFELLRKHNFRIGLVTPELHATSPGLLGAESHADAKDLETLEARMRQIASLSPEILCTDHPELQKKILS